MEKEPLKPRKKMQQVPLKSKKQEDKALQES